MRAVVEGAEHERAPRECGPGTVLREGVVGIDADPGRGVEGGSPPQGGDREVVAKPDMTGDVGDDGGSCCGLENLHLARGLRASRSGRGDGLEGEGTVMDEIEENPGGGFELWVCIKDCDGFDGCFGLRVDDRSSRGRDLVDDIY